MNEPENIAMAKHNELGKTGEGKAASYLQRCGYLILERNWRWRRLELDLICEKEGVLVVVEVKTRQAGEEHPEELLDYRKRCHLRNAAEAYVRTKGVSMEVRFDLIILTGDELKIEHIVDAVQPFE